MADLNYKVGMDTSQATTALRGMKSQVDLLSGALQALGGVLALRSLAQFADSITNVRNRLNQLVPTQQEVNQSFQALAAIAITARAPLESVSDLYFRIAKASKELGISQQEAATITESVAKAISASGISAAEASGPLLQLGQALQSGRFQGDELRSILEGLPPVARALADSMGVPVGALKELGSQGKITAAEFIKAMREAKDSIDENFAKTVPTIAQSFEVLRTTIAVVFDKFEQGSGTGRQLAVVIEYIAAEIFFLGESIDELMGPITTFFKILAAIAAFTIVGKVIRGISAAITALTSSVSGAVGVLGSVGGALAAWFGVEKISDDISNVGKEGSKSAEKIKRFREEMAKLKTGLDKTAGTAAPPFLDPEKIEKAKSAIEGVVNAYLRAADSAANRLSLENSLIGASEQQKQIKTALFNLENEYLQTVTKLTDDYIAKSKSGKQEDLAMLPEIQAAIQRVSEAYKEQIGVVQGLTEENFKLNEALKQRQALAEFAVKTEIDNAKKLREIQHSIATSTMSEIEKKYADIVFAAQESARAAIEAENSRRRQLGIAKMTAAEEKAYVEAAMKGTEELIRAEKEAYEQSRTFSAGWKRALNEYVDNATNAAKRAENIFKKATQGMEDLIVNFAKTGKFEWKNFVSMMLEELLRAQIQTIFAQLLGDMRGSMGGGSSGGIMGALGGLFGGGNQQEQGGGILDTIGGLFGGGGGAIGSSANNPMYVIDIGGGGGGGGFGGMGGAQQGGGIWESIKKTAGGIWDGLSSAAGSVWEGIKSVGSGVWDAVSSVGSGVWDAVSSVGSGLSSAIGGVVDSIGGLFSGGGGGGGGGFFDDIASGIGDFFGGFFANGGNLGAGKWGIAGENGPELISGPASVTPMAGTTVVYNINAVDAMSFKQLLAQDPSFIYGLTLQGSKGVAARR